MGGGGRGEGMPPSPLPPFPQGPPERVGPLGKRGRGEGGIPCVLAQDYACRGSHGIMQVGVTSSTLD